MPIRTTFTIALLALGLAGAAKAQTPGPGLNLHRAEPNHSSPAPWAAQTPRAADFAAGDVLRKAGLARTAFDRKLGPDEVVGALGFLCGLQPSGGGSFGAYGADPHGRFLGAKLSRAF